MSLAMVESRRASLADAELLAALAERTFRDAFAGDNSPADMDAHCARRFGPEVQRREIADPQWLTLLAEADGEMIGFAQIRLAHSTSCIHHERPCELHRIYVSREWHGTGVAQQLMHDALAAAARAGCDGMWLGVWERNPKAIAFYRKLGFEVVGEHSFTLGHEVQRDLVMLVEIERPGLAPAATPRDEL